MKSLHCVMPELTSIHVPTCNFKEISPFLHLPLPSPLGFSNSFGTLFDLWCWENSFLIFLSKQVFTKEKSKGKRASSVLRNSTSVNQNVYWCLFLSEKAEYSLLLQNYLENGESIRKIKNDLWIPVSIYIANSDFTLCSIYFFFFGMTTNLPVAYSNSRPWKITSNQFLVHHCWQWHWAAYLAFFYFLFNFLNNSCIQNLQVTRWAR